MKMVIHLWIHMQYQFEFNWYRVCMKWSCRWYRDVLMKSGRKEVTDSPQWQEKPCLSAVKQPVERWTGRSSLTEHTLVFTSLCMWNLFLSCVRDRPSSVGGEKSTVLWAELTGKNKPCPIGVQEGVAITASLSKCGRVGGIYQRHLHTGHSVPVYSFYRVFNTF